MKDVDLLEGVELEIQERQKEWLASRVKKPRITTPEPLGLLAEAEERQEEFPEAETDKVGGSTFGALTRLPPLPVGCLAVPTPPDSSYRVDPVLSTPFPLQAPHIHRNTLPSAGASTLPVQRHISYFPEHPQQAVTQRAVFQQAVTQRAVSQQAITQQPIPSQAVGQQEVSDRAASHLPSPKYDLPLERFAAQGILESLESPELPLSRTFEELPDANASHQLPPSQFTSIRSQPVSSESDSQSLRSTAMEDDSQPQRPTDPIPTWLPQLIAGMQAASIGQCQPATPEPVAGTNQVLVDLVAQLAAGQQQQAVQFAAFQQAMVQTGRVQGQQEHPEIPRRTGNEFQLKATDVGKFEPKSTRNPVATQQFIDNITYSVRIYGEDRMRAVLRRCCESTKTQRWLAGLSLEEKDNINTSTAHWITYLRRDFMPPSGTLQLEAISEQFNWTQGRTPMEYATKKISLLRIAGISDQDTIVTLGLSRNQSAGRIKR